METEPSATEPNSEEVQSRNFVNFSSLDDMASARTRTAIASHAAKLRRQQRRKQPSLSAGEIVHDFLVWRRDQAPDSEDQVDAPSQSEHQRLSLRPRTVPIRLNPRPVRRAHSQPYNILGQGRKDPFATFAVLDPPEIVHEVVDHGMYDRGP